MWVVNSEGTVFVFLSCFSVFIYTFVYLLLPICIWIESSWLQSSLKCAVLIMRALRQFRLNSPEPMIFSFWDMQCNQGSILYSVLFWSILKCLRHAIPYPNYSLRFSLSLKMKSSKIFNFFITFAHRTNDSQLINDQNRSRIFCESNNEATKEIQSTKAISLRWT